LKYIKKASKFVRYAPPTELIPQPKDWDKYWFKWVEKSFWSLQITKIIQCFNGIL